MNSQWILQQRPSGMPDPSIFAWRESPLQQPAEGQLRIRVIYLSLDPASRGWMAADSYMPAVPLGEVMRGVAIGVVEETRHPQFAVGDKVVGLLGWQTYAISDGKGLSKLPDLPVPLEAHLGCFGHIGLTAYFGLMDIGQPQPGETLLVSAAAGAVGSLAGQMGKLRGCRVVGIAGGEEKCRWIREELGFDGVINYKSEDLREALQRECPNGVDIYFENVGGRTLEAALDAMNNFGRIIACGMISGYNAEAPQPGPANLFKIITKRLKMQGFIVSDSMSRAASAMGEMVPWYLEGKLKYRLDVHDGLQTAPAALRTLFEGTNRGKVIVQVSQP